MLDSSQTLLLMGTSEHLDLDAVIFGLDYVCETTAEQKDLPLLESPSLWYKQLRGLPILKSYPATPVQILTQLGHSAVRR